ncbi:MAG: type II toxin-antitoxin system Phd/YefM family antitoxin [Alphaproteobacteria bacterium]|nr:MAG: type II toxin-antitoxin system Phd/YefM family antitoxin [Alphaproteobacteria bacterium]
MVLYSFVSHRISIMRRKGAKEARNQLPALLDAAEKGQSTIVTKYGRPVAALVPIEAYGAAVRQQPLMSVAGYGDRLVPVRCESCVTNGAASWNSGIRRGCAGSAGNK